MGSIDWGAILGGSSFLGLVAFVVRDLIKAFFGKRRADADAGVREADREVTLSRATLDAMRSMQDNYEMRIKAVQADAQAQIAGARADAASSTAAAMHEVSTARSEASQARRDAAESRNIAERIEQILLRARSIVWADGPPDPRIDRARVTLGDGSQSLSALVNGSR
jgi:hypothetical protein